MNDIKIQAISGVRWNGISQVVKLSIFMLTSIVLARLLQPDDFGLLGMATVFTSFIAVFNDFGLGSAVIQSSDLDQEKLTGIFWVTVIVGFIAMTLTILFAPLVAEFYRTEKLTPLLILLSTSFLFSALGQVQLSLLMKRINFKKVAIIEIVAAISGGVIAILLAFLNYGVWALASQIIINSLVTTGFLWAMSSWRPGKNFRWKGLGSVFKYGAGLLGFNIVNYFSRNSDYLLIGKFLGAAPLGIYSFAYRIMQYPIQNITGVVNRVLFPALSQFKDVDERLREAYKKTSQLIAAVIFPLLVGVLLLAKEIIMVVFGEKWQASIVIIQVLILAGLFQSIGGMVGNIYSAKGETRKLFFWGLFSSTIAVTCIVIGLKWGILGVAVGYATASILLFIPNLAIPFRFIDLKIKDYLWSLRKQAILVGIMGIVVFLSTYIQRLATIHQVIILADNILLGTLVYLFLIIHYDRTSAIQLVNAIFGSKSCRIMDHFKL